MSQLWRSLSESLSPAGSGHGSRPPSSSESLPLYAAVAAGEACRLANATPLSHMVDDDPEVCNSYAMAAAGLVPVAVPQPPSSLHWGLFRLPTLARFLADFTLGFADGLTVPFALTAGLSSLGRTDTVVYAGMAEICAGSISMGIGGYLAARGEVSAAAAAAAAAEAEAESLDAENAAADTAVDVREEKGLSGDVFASYLAPLDLPLQLQEMIMQHIRGCPAVLEALRQTTMEGQHEGEHESERLPSPFMAGTSVALGYLLGGVLPLFPYLLVDQVQDGLLWSFVVCAVALFVFGFCKDFALSGKPWPRAAVLDGKRKFPWGDIRSSTWEGAQMVILGSVAALAAVLCVRAFEGMKVEQSGQTS